MIAHLQRSPRDPLTEQRKSFRLPDWMTKPIRDVIGVLDETESEEQLIRSADRHLYVLMRSDLMLVDLSTMGQGEQGLDVLFGSLCGMPMIGLTDRFHNAPSIVSRLNCLIAPTSVEHIVHAIELFGIEDVPSSVEMNEDQKQAAEADVSSEDDGIERPKIS